jgi:hypothetical protein
MADTASGSGDYPAAAVGFSVPDYPQLEQVPGYPVYYAPGVDSNYFFYDGMYWDLQGANWYASTWYNGPWQVVQPDAVPLFVLRVPVRYYRHPPGYFSGWSADAPPQWGVHWGRQWEGQHQGWDQWNHKAVPAAAPLPVYQRQYSGGRYPPPGEQQSLHNQNYHYQPKDAVVQKVYHEEATRKAAMPARPMQPAAQPGMPPQERNGKGAEPGNRPEARTPEPAPREKGPMQQRVEPGKAGENRPVQQQHEPAPAPKMQERPQARPPEPKEVKPPPETHAPPPKPQERPQARPPEPKEVRPPPPQARPAEKAAPPPPHEQPQARPAPPPRPAPAPREEKKEEERK